LKIGQRLLKISVVCFWDTVYIFNTSHKRR